VPAGMVQCEYCSLAVALDPGKVLRLLEHVGAYLLFNANINLSLEPCRLCLRPSPSCVFYLRKGKGTSTSCQVDLQKSWCPYLQRFSYQAAVTEAINSPCTNVPLICPLCPSTVGAVWKYNMHVHFSKHHSSANIADYFANWGTSASEKEALQRKWQSRHKTRKSRKMLKQHPLVISEQHSSRQVLP
jgi:hypothetical protein